VELTSFRFTNFINKKLPKGGNGLGAPPRGAANEMGAGALGKGKATANSIAQSFAMMVYALPVFFGWLADTKTGRFRLIWWGVIICAIAHLLMVSHVLLCLRAKNAHSYQVGSSAPGLLASGKAFAPFVISVYTLAIGAGKCLLWNF
jgi:dipeptide/tripeptide permease